MPVDKVTPDQFAQLAIQEGVPVADAFPFFAIESTLGTNDAAYLHPDDRAGKNGMTINPDKIGYGPMQMTRPTWNMVMPDVNFDTASPVELTIGGLRYLKTFQNPDGSINMDKAIPGYFGAGNDKSFKKTKDGKIVAMGSGIDVAAGEKAYTPAKDRYYEVLALRAAAEDAQKTGLSLVDAAASIDKKYRIQGLTSSPLLPQVAAVQAQRAKEFDAVGAVTEAAAAARSSMQASIQDKLNHEAMNRDQMAKILDAFHSNPAGAFDAVQRMGDTLTNLQGDLVRQTAWANFEGPVTASNPVAGFLQSFAQAVAGQVGAPKTAEQIKTLTAAQKEINDVITSTMTNAQRAQTPTSTLNAIESSARQNAQFDFNLSEAAVKTSAVQDRIALGQAQLDLRQRQNEANIAIRQADSARKASDSEVRRMRVEQQNTESEARIQALLAKTANKNVDLDNINSTLADIAKESGQSAPQKFGSFKAWQAVHKSNPQLFNLVMNRIASGNNLLAGATPQEALATVASRTDDPVVRAYVSKIQNALGQSALQNYVNSDNQRKQEWMIATDKGKAVLAQEYENQILRNVPLQPTSSTDFSGDLKNMGVTLGQVVQSAAPTNPLIAAVTKLADTSTLVGDKQLFTLVARLSLDGKLPMPKEEVEKDLQKFYADYADTRAKNNVLFQQLGLPIPRSTYYVKDTIGGGKVDRAYNLTTLRDVQSYLEKTAKEIESKNSGISGFFSNLMSSNPSGR